MPKYFENIKKIEGWEPFFIFTEIAKIWKKHGHLGLEALLGLRIPIFLSVLSSSIPHTTFCKIS